jgi:hypothetical protein
MRVCAQAQGFGRDAAGKLAQNHRFSQPPEFCNCLLVKKVEARIVPKSLIC